MAKKGIDGSNWKFEVYFDPEADARTGHSYRISDGELITQLSRLVDAREKKKEVTAYKVPLSNLQLTQFLLYHMLTENCWWSIEKNDEGITIQRSKSLRAVRERYRQRNRNFDIKCMKKDAGSSSVKGLIDWLWANAELEDEYHLLESNCQHFGKKVFNFVAKNIKNSFREEQQHVVLF